MLILLSPSKSMDFAKWSDLDYITQARFLHSAESLNAVLKEMSPTQLEKVLKVSPKLAASSYERIQIWDAASHQKGKPAVFAYSGDAYEGLNIRSFTEEEIKSAQQNLRIISALYGVLRPMDAIIPYRLDMASPLAIENHKTLHSYWQSSITQCISDDIKTAKTKTIVNLASKEYADVIDFKKIAAHIIHPVFKEVKGGKSQSISFYAKRARGLMTAWIIKNKATEVDHLSAFMEEGYLYHSMDERSGEILFLRESRY